MLISNLLTLILLSWPKMGKETIVVGPTTWTIYRVRYNLRYRYWNQYTKRFDEGTFADRGSTELTYEQFIANPPKTDVPVAAAIWHEEIRNYVWAMHDQLWPI